MKKLMINLLLIGFCYPLLADTSSYAKASADRPKRKQNKTIKKKETVSQQKKSKQTDKNTSSSSAHSAAPANLSDEALAKTEASCESQKDSPKENVLRKKTNQKSKPKKIKIGQPDASKEEWKSFLKSCSSSLFIGALIGGLSGQASAYTAHHQCNYDSNVKRWCATAVNWFLWSAARQAVLEMIEEEMDIYHIKHNKTLMETTGYCSDWLSYVYAMYKIYQQ